MVSDDVLRSVNLIAFFFFFFYFFSIIFLKLIAIVNIGILWVLKYMILRGSNL